MYEITELIKGKKLSRQQKKLADFFIQNANSKEFKLRLKEKYAKQLGVAVDKQWYLFAPTWRHDNEYLYSFSTSSAIKDIERILVEQNAILIEKQHPIILETMKLNTKASPFLRIVSQNEARIIDTQELLSACDRLITDYSSIYFDFVLMNRPVIHYVYDYKHFMNLDFGFIYDIRNYGGGPFAYTENELLSFMRYKDDELLNLRNEATKKELLEYEQGKACEGYYSLFEKLATSKNFFSL